MAEQKTQERGKTKQELPPEATSKGAVATIQPPRIPFPNVAASRYDIDEQMWDVLVNATYPNAKTWQGVVLALEYCKRRGLDIMKKPVHIVPMRTRIGDKWVDIETVWPSVMEVRATAFRTKQYVGRDSAVFGPDKVLKYTVPAKSDGNDHPNAPDADKKAKQPDIVKELIYPEWCQVTVYRMVDGQRCAFPGPRVYWLETYATAGRGTDAPNEMWGDRPHGQLEKCGEVAALRAAFPEEIGSEEAFEEVERRAAQAKDVTPQADKRPERSDYKDEPKPEEKKAAPIIEGEVSKPADDDTFPGDKPLKSEPKREPTDEEIKEREMREFLEEKIAILNRTNDGAEIQEMHDGMKAELADFPRLFDRWQDARERRIGALNGRK